MEKPRKCLVCGRSTESGSGWHLKFDINLCNSGCAFKLIERVVPILRRKLNEHEQRIIALEQYIGGG